MASTPAGLRPKPRLGFWDVWNMSFGFLGIQFGFALQNANVSRIFETLGAKVDDIPLLWIAAPVTGLVVQPIIGYMSDRTWTRLGRRRPYFFVGAILASLALVVMPHSPALWIAAGMLWIMDASINISMEPFRAFVGDSLAASQRITGFAMQSFFIGTGAVVASILPWLLTTRFGVSNQAPPHMIPDSVRLSFYMGAAVFFVAILWTVLRSKEYSPEEMATFEENQAREAFTVAPRTPQEFAARGGSHVRLGFLLLAVGVGFTIWLGVEAIYQVMILSAGIAVSGILLIVGGLLQQGGRYDNGFVTILNDFLDMPRTMRQLAWAQFFSWFALFAMWIYTTAAVTSHLYGTTDTTSAVYNEGANWVGVGFAAYNGVAALVSFAIPPLARWSSPKVAHVICLLCGALGLISIFFIADPRYLLGSMVGVGIAWASILAMPYAILTGSLPPSKLGYYMGVFNFFIVIPQIVAAALLGFIVGRFFNGEAIYALLLGGGSFILAAALTLRVQDDQARGFARMTIVARCILLTGLLAAAGCSGQRPTANPPNRPAGVTAPAAVWNAGTIYFLLTDRFENGNPANDTALGRKHDGAVLRSFEGGDLAGVLQRINAGYFDSLGVTAIWLTPFVEQVHGSVDEGTGKTWGYHGYWARDWTAVDPALGTADDLRAVVDAAHRHHIRVLMDAVVNHTGPVTPQDPRWPADWVRANPNCTYKDYTTTVTCNLVASLPDVLTERKEPVGLPPALVAQWTREGRLEREQAELETFFKRTGYPRAPRYYLIKWLTDWVREYGIDGYRVDTAKHFEETVSAELKKEAGNAFADWKRANPEKVLDQLPFYMVGEVYGWEESQGRQYNYGDRTVDFFAFGYDALINFGFKREAAGSMDSLFTRYATALSTGPLHGVSLLNYVTNHDDGAPYDLNRADPFGAGTRLLLAPGTAQIYYGDELARPLKVSGTQGDANLRSFMNWADQRGDPAAAVLRHWQRLGQFRHAHPAVGAGVHRRLRESPYIFSRTLRADGVDDRVLVALDLAAGDKTVPVFELFPDGTELLDTYSGTRGRVANGSVTFGTPYGLLLLSRTHSTSTP